MNKRKCVNCGKITGLKTYYPDLSLCRFCNDKYKRNLSYKKRNQNLKELRREAINSLGGVCLFCGFSDPRALQFDHVNGGGSQHTKTITAKKFYESIINNSCDVEIQLLCANCNWIKKCENNEVRTRQYACNIINIK